MSNKTIGGFTTLLILGAITVLQPAIVTAHPGNDRKLVVFNQQITANPDQPGWYLQRAKLFIDDGHYQLALDDIAKAERLGGGGETAFLKGLVFSRQGQPAKAISYFNLFLDHYPDDVLVLEARATAARANGDIQAAYQDYQRVLAKTLYPNPGLYLSAAKLALLVKDRAEAVSVIDDANEKLGITPQLQQYAIALEVESQRWGKALDRLQSLAPMMQSSPDWHVQRAELLKGLHRHAEAVDALDTAERLLKQFRPTPQRMATGQAIQQLRLAL